MGFLLALAGLSLLLAPSAGSSAQEHDAALKIFRTAIEHERKAAELYPFEEEEAIAELEASAAKLDEMKDLKGLPDGVKLRAARAAFADRETAEAIPFTSSDDWELIFQEMRWAMEVKREGIDLIHRDTFKATDKKKLSATRVKPPECESQSEAVSSCYTLDSWAIYVPIDTRKALCDFRDADGRRLTNLRPLFDEVVQRVTCNLSEQTKVVGGVEKRVVRAKLRLTALSGMSSGGSAKVSVTALSR